MIACPNCNHQNPEGAAQCEACYTPLPSLIACPNCGAQIQSDASFCGQCGFDLQQAIQPTSIEEEVFYGMEGEVGSTAYTPPNESESVAIPVNLPNSPQAGVVATQLQSQTATLLHVQTNTVIPLSSTVGIVHIGKPGGPVAPDLDVSGFPDSAIVSRVHADLRVEGDAYYLEDMGSSNGTYVNHTPLMPGNRHRLRPGDRIALGKEDKVTFIFQLDAP
ncbi:MAG: FHA domain-containing protein [Spirulina sp. SIO3F2]|nr:FHA domain-containing protein [Spirulina sp. SIO3F2]